MTTPPNLNSEDEVFRRLKRKPINEVLADWTLSDVCAAQEAESNAIRQRQDKEFTDYLTSQGWAPEDINKWNDEQHRLKQGSI